MMSRRSGRGAEVVTIYWRDIPAQVNGQDGRDRHQVLLSSKFQRAVDRAKRKAGIYTAEEDIAQWRRTSEPCADGVDHVSAAEVRASAIEVEYSREFLGKLAYAGGYLADVTDVDVDRDVLLALEELEDAHDDVAAGTEAGNVAGEATSD
jgi:hypothetical protein